MNSSEENSHPSLEHYPNVEENRPALFAAIERTGTPIFLCQRQNLIDRYQVLTGSLDTHWGPHIVGYSFKTNYLVEKKGDDTPCCQKHEHDTQDSRSQCLVSMASCFFPARVSA